MSYGALISINLKSLLISKRVYHAELRHARRAKLIMSANIAGVVPKVRPSNLFASLLPPPID